MLHVYPPPYFWILHIDGSAKPNPGRMAAAAVLTGPDASCRHCAHVLPDTGCNNEAEARALLMGLQLALQQGADHLRIYTDSQWLVQQLAQPSGPGPLVRPTVRLLPLLQTLHAVLKTFHTLQWRWVPRHCNTEADTLATQARCSADN